MQGIFHASQRNQPIFITNLIFHIFQGNNYCFQNSEKMWYKYTMWAKCILVVLQQVLHTIKILASMAILSYVL